MNRKAERYKNFLYPLWPLLFIIIEAQLRFWKLIYDKTKLIFFEKFIFFIFGNVPEHITLNLYD